jgi:hypothetical protein
MHIDTDKLMPQTFKPAQVHRWYSKPVELLEEPTGKLVGSE